MSWLFFLYCGNLLAFISIYLILSKFTKFISKLLDKLILIMVSFIEAKLPIIVVIGRVKKIASRTFTKYGY